MMLATASSSRVKVASIQPIFSEFNVKVNTSKLMTSMLAPKVCRQEKHPAAARFLLLPFQRFSSTLTSNRFFTLNR
jgi:hypothetical protein